MTVIRPEHDVGRPADMPLGPRAGLAAAAAAATMVLALTVALAFPASGLAGMIAALSLAGIGLAVVAVQADRHYPHSGFGWCNSVTLLRGALTAALLAPVAGGGGSGWAVAGIATLALALDGVDGRLARLEGRVSSFGARFDMEVDCVFAAILALSALASGAAGPAILLIGFARYFYLAAGSILPWLRAELPERLSRKAVCVLQLATLIAIQVPVMPEALATLLIWLTAAALTLSFGRDAALLWRSRS